MKVSVALCTYNGEKYIEQQLNSILNQNYPVEEIQIGDDGSIDHGPSCTSITALPLFPVYSSRITQKTLYSYYK